MEKINRFIRQVGSLPILFYQFLLSPILPACCRYYPSCSQYALEAIKRFGLIKGGWCACCRIARCHPWASGGYDPVLSNDEKS